MDKTDLMLKYEQETGRPSQMGSSNMAQELASYGYIEWLEAKATTCDRLLSESRMTLQEVANFTRKIVTVDADGQIGLSDSKPYISDMMGGIWLTDDFRGISSFPQDNVTCTGDWKDSMTFPDGWEEK